MYSLLTSINSAIIWVRYSLLMNGFEMPMVNFPANGLRDKELLNFFVGHDVVEQVCIGLAFAHRQTIRQVFLGDDRRQRENEGQAIHAAELGLVNLSCPEAC